jgi:chromosome segregation ATPase
MTKRALIAEPDQDEALRQAAILKDDGFDASVFTGTDIVQEVESSPPDVLILRHERQGPTGLALVPRLKTVAPQLAIVLTTSDLTPDAIDKNKKQKVHADWYLQLPVDRGELVGAARAAPKSAADSSPPTPAEDVKSRDPTRPPPLPPAGLRALGQLPRATPRGTGDAVLTAEDLTFVEKVFSSIQHVDADAPIAEPPPSAIGDTPDRKLALLRTKLKERERDLAKLSRLWRAREEDLRQQEARVQQKDIEIEGLRLRISELTADLESANAQLVDKEAEWGRQIGETYEQHSLNEAELIQAVAAKEAELNRQKTTLRKLEDQAAAERKDFTNRILEWEKAYADFEQHHWKVVMASVEEVERLEVQIRQREADRSTNRADLRDRENTIVVLRERQAALQERVWSLENESKRTEDRALVAVESALAIERRRGKEAFAELSAFKEEIVVVEEDLRRHQKLLEHLEVLRREQISELASMLRENGHEAVRLSDERTHHQRRAEALEAALSTATALGEAVAASLFALDDKKSIILREQTRIRDEKLAEFAEDRARLEDNVSDLTGRLGQEEMDHAAESARADELERELAETRERLATTETRLQGALEGMTGERDRLTERLTTTEQHLGTTREELSNEKHSRQQRELEVAGLMERKENELRDRSARVEDLERSLADTKEDLSNLRKTVSTRDERITELLNRVRDADEKQVQLEGQIYRLETSNSEKEANLIARDERIAALSEKLSQRDDRIESVEGELKKTQGIVLDRDGELERQHAALEDLRRQIASAKEETVATRAEVQARSNELFETERRASTLKADLDNARTEIASGAAVTEQLHAQLSQAEARGAELRAVVEETDAKLRATLVDLESAGQRNDQHRSEIAELRTQVDKRGAELSEKSQFLAEVERSRDQLQATLTATRQMLEQQIMGVEAEKGELEEQLAQQASENGALSASLSDAATRIEELQLRVRTAEAAAADREGRISAQEQILEKASQQTDQQRALLEERERELVELRQAHDDAKSAIEERARWLATRETTIAELKAALDAERAGRGDEQSKFAALDKQLKDVGERSAQLENALKTQTQKAAEAASAAARALEAERATAQATNDEVARLKAALAEKDGALQTAGAAAATLAETQKSEAHVRAEYQKLRGQAEKILADNKQLKATLEKSDGDKKAAAAEHDRLRAELAETRAQLTSGSSQAQALKADADSRAKELADAKTQLARATQQAQAAMKAKAEAEAETEATKQRLARDLAVATEAQAAETNRLNKELLDARKAQRDAMAQAQQAKAEAEQIKKMAAQRLAQRASTAPTAASSPPKPAAPASSPPKPAPSKSAAPTMVGALSPPHGASAEGNDFDSPTVVVAAGTADPFDPQRTVMVSKPDIPSLARGPDKS